ncbi:MAG: histidine phosphatase family protein [Clostridia bacterium]|nr:histidine phosphatase family protein [Clostridia bacterium]
MTRIIFVRHGESMGNINDLFYGHTDGDLTELGRRQAESAANYLKDVHIDIAYASDLKRAFETGEIIAREHSLEVIPNKGLTAA